MNKEFDDKYFKEPHNKLRIIVVLKEMGTVVKVSGGLL